MHIKFKAFRIDLAMKRETRISWPTLDVAPLIDGMTTRNNPNILVPGSSSDRDRSSRDDVIDAGREANENRNRRREQQEQEQ